MEYDPKLFFTVIFIGALNVFAYGFFKAFFCHYIKKRVLDVWFGMTIVSLPAIAIIMIRLINES